MIKITAEFSWLKRHAEAHGEIATRRNSLTVAVVVSPDKQSQAQQEPTYKECSAQSKLPRQSASLKAKEKFSHQLHPQSTTVCLCGIQNNTRCPS
jgi:hypothetical protein